MSTPRAERISTGASGGGGPRHSGLISTGESAGPSADAAQIEAVAADQQVEPGARSDLEHFELRAVACREVEDAGHQPSGAAGFVGLGWAVEPWQQLGVVARRTLR